MSENLKGKSVPFKPSVTIVKVTGANQKVVTEIKDLIVSHGFDIVMNSKHKPRVRFNSNSGLWTCFVLVHESVKPVVDEALMTVEGLE